LFDDVNVIIAMFHEIDYLVTMKPRNRKFVSNNRSWAENRTGFEILSQRESSENNATVEIDLASQQGPSRVLIIFNCTKSAYCLKLEGN
jgi:hypothetical protein